VKEWHIAVFGVVAVVVALVLLNFLISDFHV